MQVYVHENSKLFLIRWILLLAILVLELVLTTASYKAPLLLINDVSWSAWLFHFSKEIWRIGMWITGTYLILVSPRFKIILSDLYEHLVGYHWKVWLVFHALVFASFAVVTELIFEIPTHPAHLSVYWFAGWFALLSATLLLWLLALAPGQFWLQLIRQEYTALFMSCVTGIGSWILIGRLGQYEISLLGQNEFWNLLATPTLQLVHTLLSCIYSNLIYQPARFVLGTPSFQVEISYACSGIEGISLIIIFLTIYLWLFRKELRFPQAFWLFPLGIIIIWLANALRIATLIVIGASFSPEIALGGFHAQAGWIIFTLIAIGAIALSKQIQFFTVTQPDIPAIKTSKSLITALLVPLLALIATSMVTSVASNGFDVFYPLRIMAVAMILYYFRKGYIGLGWTWSWQAPAIGAVAFIIWMLLEPSVDSSKTLLSQGLAQLSSKSATAWLIFRVLGSVIIVPMAEELAFRGYLIRKLIAKDFENIPLAQFSWFSFIITSVLFGVLHERWIAGTLAGMCYALALMLSLPI